ncbi:unnamed protein product [Urochloa humidicola]
MAPPSPPLPLDALYEVFLRVPAKDLCRLRAVCRPWRVLLSDPQFIAAHAACHPEPLIVAARNTDDNHLVDIMDLSGRVIKRVVKPGRLWAGWKEWAITAEVDVVCVLMRNDMSYRLLNPATGAVSALPQGFAEEHLPWAWNISDVSHLIAVGKVASTGEYKVLRVLDRYSEQEQLCEVFTLDGSTHARWRGKKVSPASLRYRVTINGVVYFLLSERVMGQGVEPMRIASFDLEAEEWMAILQGPLNIWTIPSCYLSLASLNGCLVVNHHIHESSSLDLWFLMDFEKGLWAKQHSIQLELGFDGEELSVRPLLMLNDGRILHYKSKLLRIYDPETCISRDVGETFPYYELGLCTVNLLSLPADA